jgi:DNA-binding NarL/FixJ family response regulator
VDDSEVVRTKLRGLLQAEGIEVAGEAAEAVSGIRLVRELRPDVVIMDLRMPGMSGIEATWQLGSVAPSSRVLVLTVSADQEDVTDAIMAGARGYVVKGAGDDEIIAAVKGVAAGERVISPQIASKLAERAGGAESRQPGTRERAAPEQVGVAEPRRRAPEPAPSPIESRPPAFAWTVAIALVGGALLTGIGQGQEILDGAASADTWVEAGLNFVVAFAIAGLVRLVARAGG